MVSSGWVCSVAIKQIRERLRPSPVLAAAAATAPSAGFAWAVRVGAIAVVLSLGLASLAAAAETTAAGPRIWSIGEIIDSDIITPVALTVFHPDETAVLRATEMPRVPAVWRHDPTAVEAAGSELRARFAAARERFGAMIEHGFGERPLRAVARLNDPRFHELKAAFRREDPEFPLGDNLAELWSLGDAGRVVLEDYVGQLRRFMSAFLRPDRTPEDISTGTSTAWILSEEREGNGGATRGPVLQTATLSTVSRYRRDLRDLAPASDRAVLAFLAGFLRPNCSYDPDMSEAVRARRWQELNVVDHHDAGSVIARRGDRVDARRKRTLDALVAQLQTDTATGSAARLQAELQRARTEASQLKARVEAERRQAAEELASQKRSFRLRATLVTVALLGLLTGAAAWWWRRRRPAFAGSGLTDDLAVVTAGMDGLDGREVEAWRERALAAEARAAKATAMLRARLLPHMARWMMSELVQRLVHQRSVARSSQQRAEQEVAELAARLEKLHAPLEERRRAYEQRIQDLEEELAARDRHEHELIQARIESTRRRLLSDREDRPEHFAS